MGSLRKWLGWQDSGVGTAAWADRPISPSADGRDRPSEDGRTDLSADGPAPNVRPRPVSLTTKTALRIVHRRVEFSTLRLDEAVRRFNTPDPFRVDHRQHRLAS